MPLTNWAVCLVDQNIPCLILAVWNWVNAILFMPCICLPHKTCLYLFLLFFVIKTEWKNIALAFCISCSVPVPKKVRSSCFVNFNRVHFKKCKNTGVWVSADPPHFLFPFSPPLICEFQHGLEELIKMKPISLYSLPLKMDCITNYTYQ